MNDTDAPSSGQDSAQPSPPDTAGGGTSAPPDAGGVPATAGTGGADSGAAAADPAAGGGAGPVNVQLVVPLIPQPTGVSCWAASIAMVASCRDAASHTVEEVAARAQMDPAASYAWRQIEFAVQAWQLKEDGSVCALPSYWATLLQDHGPAWVVEVRNAAHAVVVTGIQGDGTPEGTTMTINNPLPVGVGASGISQAFLEFEREFELGSPANAMIVHA